MRLPGRANLWVTAVLAGLLCTSCSREPTSLASRFSGLDLPSSGEVLQFEDEASGLVGEDLFVRVVLRYENEDFSGLLVQAASRGYTRVPEGVSYAEAVSRLSLPEVVWDLLRDVESGLVKYEAHSESSWSVAVLDRMKRTLTVEYVII